MRDDSGALATPIAIRLEGPLAEQARDATLALLESLGVRAAALGETDDAAVAARLAAAGLVTVATTDTGHDAVEIAAPADRSPEEAARRALAAVDHALEVASRPIFVVGGARSGTTWTIDLLSSHPRVAGLFETEIFQPGHLGLLHRRVSFEPVTHPDGFAKGLGQIARREEVVAGMRPVLARFLARGVGPEHGWVVEKTPSHVGSLEAIADLFPDARIVNVVRDLRDVLVSRRAGARDSWDATRRPWAARVRRPFALVTAREWVTELERAEAARARLPVHDVAYEALHADPERELAALFAFCEIPADEALVREVVAANAFSRLPNTGFGEFRRAGRVGDWRTDLRRRDRLLAGAVAGRALTERGYTARPGAAYRAARVVQRARRRGRP